MPEVTCQQAPLAFRFGRGFTDHPLKFFCESWCEGIRLIEILNGRLRLGQGRYKT